MLNLSFLSPNLSQGIDKVLVCLCPCGFNNPRNTLRWKLLQLAFLCLRIILLCLRTANISPLWSPCLYHPIFILECSAVAIALQASCSQPWPSGSYYIHKHSELSRASSLSTKTTALGHDTSWCSHDEWSTSTYGLHPESSSSKLISLVQPAFPWTTRPLPHPRGNNRPLGHLVAFFVWYDPCLHHSSE
jgi:hypothetical protein